MFIAHSSNAPGRLLLCITQGIEYTSLVCLIPEAIQGNHSKTIRLGQIALSWSAIYKWSLLVIGPWAILIIPQSLWSFYSTMCSRDLEAQNHIPKDDFIILWDYRTEWPDYCVRKVLHVSRRFMTHGKQHLWTYKNAQQRSWHPKTLKRAKANLLLKRGSKAKLTEAF